MLALLNCSSSGAGANSETQCSRWISQHRLDIWLLQNKAVDREAVLDQLYQRRQIQQLYKIGIYKDGVQSQELVNKMAPTQGS